MPGPYHPTRRPWRRAVYGVFPVASALVAALLCVAPASAGVVVEIAGAEGDDPRVAHAQTLLATCPLDVVLRIDAGIGHREGYRLRVEGSRASVAGGGPAGVLYGAQELARLQPPPTKAAIFDRPDFELRGNALFLMKDASYNFQLSPTEFPWFFDRPLLTRYLDYLFENRFNAIFLWSGNLFPSIVEMPEYPDSTDLPREQLLRNQEQFRWFTNECARRNISVLLHFYQIHIPVPLARSRKIPVAYSQPNDFLRQYMRYVLKRFLTEFQSVGLYVCPGEALHPRYQPEWIRDVIFAAAREAGHNPPIVVRDWTLDAKRFKEVCVGQYDNLYTELKHNIEMIVSPVPDDRHRIWKGVARKHIVNVHEVADVKPFRWGSPAFIQEMVREWRRVGLDGAEVYGMTSWRWPYSLDRLEPHQKGFWPEGRKLLTFERDAIWLQAIGRYLWHVDRSPRGEARYWERVLAPRFGESPEAGRLARQWYEVTGPVLPGLQNLTSYMNMNFYPTAVGREQTVDGILSARVAPGSVEAPTGNHPSRPVDSLFFARYRREYRVPGLRNRISMPVSQYADLLARGRRPRGVMTPDRVAALLVRMAREGVVLARKLHAAARANSDEAARFVSDSEALLLIARAWQQKVLAAIRKRIWLKTGQVQQAERSLAHLRESVRVYEALVALTDRTYLNPTDMLLSLNWHEGLKAFREDLKTHEELFESVREGRLIWGQPSSFEVYGPVGRKVLVRFVLPRGTEARGARIQCAVRDLDGTRPGEEGVLRLPDGEVKLPPTGDGATKPMEFPVSAESLASGRLQVEFELIAKPGNTLGFSVSNCRLVLARGGREGRRRLRAGGTAVSAGG